LPLLTGCSQLMWAEIIPIIASSGKHLIQIMLA
jgi:hypothetical protein